MLLNEVQKQYRRGQDQAEVIQAQEQQIKELKERLTWIEKILSSDAASAESHSVPANLPRKLVGQGRLVTTSAQHTVR